MVCEKPIEQPKAVDSGFILSKSPENAMVASESGVTSDSTSSNQYAAPGIKSETGQESAAGQDVYNPPASYYNYYFPGCNGSFGQSDDGRDHSSMGVQTNHNSIAYYMPGYNPYAAGTFVGADGHCVSQPYYTPVTYGAEALPCYAWDYNYHGDPSTGSNTTSGNVKSNPSPATVRSNGIKPSKLYGSMSKVSSTSVNSKSRPSVAAPNVSQPKFDVQPSKPVNKSGSCYPSAGFTNAYHPGGNYQSLSFPKRGVFGNAGPMGYRPNSRMWNGNDKFRPNRKSELEMSAELTCGPRSNNKINSDSSEKELLGPVVRGDQYNLADFQTEYKAAKFYVIKSYSEDDVHKCIKYDVWSSTANGNKKLDAAFHDAEVKANETGVKCPVFLFFSVNGSGQFVGVAEMIGKVDFNKNMDFWQLDKWSGFFPVKWHIVKDIPNSLLRHIHLENNDNRPVTYTRDTQEIGLKQGLEMLKIFKNYLAKTALIDDLEFYEGREKALEVKRCTKSGTHQTQIFGNGNLPKQLETEAKGGEELNKSNVAPVSALVNLTNNLSISSDPKVAL